MAFLTPGRRVNAVPHITLRAPSGRLIHQPVRLRGDFTTTGLAPLATPASITPARTATAPVSVVQRQIIANETLRIAAPGPGLPGSYVAPSVLRDTVGRIVGARPGVTDTPNTAAASDLFGRMAAKIPGAGAIVPDASGMTPTGVDVTPEQFDQLTGGGMGTVPGYVPGAVPLPGEDRSRCPGLSPLECLWALHQKDILLGALGFVAGFALLRWRSA